MRVRMVEVAGGGLAGAAGEAAGVVAQLDPALQPVGDLVGVHRDVVLEVDDRFDGHAGGLLKPSADLLGTDRGPGLLRPPDTPLGSHRSLGDGAPAAVRWYWLVPPQTPYSPWVMAQVRHSLEASQCMSTRMQGVRWRVLPDPGTWADAAGRDVAWLGDRRWIRPRRQQLAFREPGDRLHAVAQVAPERLQVGGAGEASRHADDGDVGAVIAAESADGGVERFKQDVGLPLATYFSGTKIEWLLENVEGLREKAQDGGAVFGTIDAWLVFKLTGEHRTDVTNASRTMLYDIHRGAWDDELLALFGDVPEAALPEVLPSIGEFGKLRDGALGAGHDGVPVSGIAGDQQAALYGQGCLEPGLGKNTYGTGSFVLLNSGDSVPMLTATARFSLASRRASAPTPAASPARRSGR